MVAHPRGLGGLPAAVAAGHRLWLVGEGPAAEQTAHALEACGDVAANRGALDWVLTMAAPGDWVLLAGLAPSETVAASERILAQGLHAAIEVTEAPALQRALGRHRWGRDWVILSPQPPLWLSVLALRARDVIGAGLALAFLCSVIILLALLVQLSSLGPAFYATQVVGRDGRLFTWRKLRTMRVAAPTDDEAWRRERFRAFMDGRPPPSADDQPAEGDTVRKVVDESRITGIGRVLRRHSPDKLPQLWNVMRGDMTLVGPRPSLPYEYEMFAPWQRLRYKTTPGLTGPWQAYGRSQVSFDEMALMDYCYGHVKSFWLDLRLIARTALIIVTGEGGK